VSKNRALVGLTVGATGALLALGATPAMADNHTATISVLHAVPETPVDVYANGELLLDDFEPGTLTDPQELPAGAYDIQVFPADAPDGSGEALFGGSAEVPAGANATVVAHLAEDGTPTLTPFVNDTSAVEAGQARVTVRHTAAAPAVDVRAGGDPVFENLTNPKEAKADLPAATVKADVVLAGTGTVALGPADLNLKEGTATIVYAVGSAEEETLELVAQTITGLHSAPGGVPSGSGGLADRGLSGAWYALAALGLLFLVGAGRYAVVARRS